MKNKMKKISVCLLASLYLTPTGIMLAQNQEESVNISPIGELEFDFGLEDATENSSLNIESEDETQAVNEESSQEETSDSETAAELAALDPSVPHSLIEMLQQNRDHATSDITIFENTSDEEFQEKTRAYIRDQDIYYMILIEGMALPEMYLLATEEEQIQQSYIAVDDLMSMTADLLNTDPDTYEGTVVEDFYLASQENIEDFSGKFVDNTSQNEMYQTEFLETIAIDELLLTVMLEWLQDDSVKDTGLAVDDGMVFGLDETTEPIFADIFDQYSEDYPELDRLKAMFSTGFQGNIALNFELMELGVGLVGEGGGIQYFLRLEEFEIPQPIEEQLYSVEEFNELLGFDIIEELDQVRQEMVPETE